eukprot:1176113-Prorocentrum_minimum.AAC.1
MGVDAGTWALVLRAAVAGVSPGRGGFAPRVLWRVCRIGHDKRGRWNNRSSALRVIQVGSLLASSACADNQLSGVCGPPVFQTPSALLKAGGPCRRGPRDGAAVAVERQKGVRTRTAASRFCRFDSDVTARGEGDQDDVDEMLSSMYSLMSRCRAHCGARDVLEGVENVELALGLHGSRCTRRCRDVELAVGLDVLGGVELVVGLDVLGDVELVVELDVLGDVELAVVLDVLEGVET